MDSLFNFVYNFIGLFLFHSIHKMKVALVTCSYKRYELTKIVLKYYTKTFPDIILTVVTEEYPNFPLAQKFNHAFEFAKDSNPDAVILIGSDDLLSPELISYYQTHYNARADYVLGLKDLFFYEIAPRKQYYFSGLKGKYVFPIGAGRIFSKKILDKLNWRPYGDMIINRGLDTNSSLYMARQGIGHKMITMKESGAALALKDRVSINPMAEWQNCKEIPKPVPEPFIEVVASIHALPIDVSNFIPGTKKKCRLIVEYFDGDRLGNIGEEMELEATTALGMFRNKLIEIIE